MPSDGDDPLAEARALSELYAEKGGRKYERAALRYLGRYLAEANPSLADVAQVAAFARGAQSRSSALLGHVQLPGDIGAPGR